MKSKKLQLQPKTEADRYAALFARSCILLMHWQNAAMARSLAKSDIERAAAARAEADVLTRTNEFLKL